MRTATSNLTIDIIIINRESIGAGFVYKWLRYEQDVNSKKIM